MILNILMTTGNEESTVLLKEILNLPGSAFSALTLPICTVYVAVVSVFERIKKTRLMLGRHLHGRALTCLFCNYGLKPIQHSLQLSLSVSEPEPIRTLQLSSTLPLLFVSEPIFDFGDSNGKVR